MQESCHLCERGQQPIEKGAFRSCMSLKEIEIPASVEYMAPGLFSGLDVAGLGIAGENPCYCMNGSLVLSSDRRLIVSIFRCVCQIEIPASVEVLCEECFSGSGLSRVTFASGSRLQRIEKGAFRLCNSLKEVEIPASVSCDGDVGVLVRRR